MFKRYIAVSFLLIFSLSSVYAQFYKVYGYNTRVKNEFELVLWNSAIPKSGHTYMFFGKSVLREGLWAHSIEIEYGLTDRWTTALYVDFEDPKGESIRYY